ncbi:hypothetical protein [Saccharothrix sp. NRRL B-16314]|uniref:hypothetical protein n=1 Tax=Saccharothrix sp. NRRL B-16314 TaxID=1463825 RepID=UPI0012DD8D4F|nr:hypothetical protein [Saccharothrix sp. NRRL B-16314]
MTTATPSADTRRLATRVAASSGIDAPAVEAVFASHGVPASPIPAAPRSLRVLRLRLWGHKRDIPESGSFDTTLQIPRGLVMAVAPNLKGKTSLLELITWCLRGTPKALQHDVISWLEGVECDVLVNDVPHGVRMRLHDGAIADAVIVKTNSIEDLAAARSHSPGNAVVIARARSNAEYEAEIQAFMLDRLGLEPILAYASKTGVMQTHSWPAYFGAVYPPAGGEKVLIGETAFAGLAGRLLEVFLDLPGAALLTRVKAARDRLSAEHNKQLDLVKTAADLDRARRAEQQLRLETAQRSLTDLLAESDVPSATEAAERVTVLSLQLADTGTDRRAADVAHRQARAARQADRRRLNDVRESAVARRLFHGLDPQACPRCEAPVTAERRTAEAARHHCAVCTSPIDVQDDEDEELLNELLDAVAASQRAEDAARETLSTTDEVIRRLTLQLAAAEAELRDAQQAGTATKRAELEREIARAEGALEILQPSVEETASSGTTEDSIELRVLRALAEILEADLKAASVRLFAELGPEIAALARRFGIASVQQVKIDRRAALAISKGGAKPDSFSGQSPGERLRLRIATVIALLRVGARLGIATHPGLLMLDSLRAEEVQEEDAHAILAELIGIARETPELQMLTTTADMTLPVGRLPDEAILAPPEGRDALW